MRSRLYKAGLDSIKTNLGRKPAVLIVPAVPVPAAHILKETKCHSILPRATPLELVQTATEGSFVRRGVLLTVISVAFEDYQGKICGACIACGATTSFF